MRYVIINSEGKEVSFDLSLDARPSNIRRVKISKKDEINKDYYVRELGGKTYISEDKKTWRKLPRISSRSTLVNGNENLKIYRGFKPSGLSNTNAGDLITQMPGKIIKVMTVEGAVVQAGDTLVILEAMKMENEIKAGIDGIIKAVHIKEGQILESGHLLIEIDD